MNIHRRLTAVLLACALLTFTACPSKVTLLSSATDVLQSLTDAQPLINQLLPKASGKITNAITIATKMKDAIAKSDADSAAAYLSDLIPVFQSIVNNDLPGLPVATQTEILVVLAVGNIALHFLLNHLQSNLPVVASALPTAKQRALDSFASEAVWGNRYKRK
jgi:hypothetical protein